MHEVVPYWDLCDTKHLNNRPYHKGKIQGILWSTLHMLPAYHDIIYSIEICASIVHSFKKVSESVGSFELWFVDGLQVNPREFIDLIAQSILRAADRTLLSVDDHEDYILKFLTYYHLIRERMPEPGYVATENG